MNFCFGVCIRVSFCILILYVFEGVFDCGSRQGKKKRQLY
jgi:hypothetical protein